MQTKIKLEINWSWLLMLFCILYSCNEEYTHELPEDDVIVAAQNWFLNENPQKEILKYSHIASKQMKMKPLWEKAFYRKYNDVSVVEVPILTQGNFGYATIDGQNEFGTSGDTRFLQSLTRIVIVSNKKERKAVGFLMTLVPDCEYRKRNNHKVFVSAYGVWQKDFSGLILYHSLDGRYLNGWKLENKIVTHTIQLQNDADQNLDFKIIPTKQDEACYNYYMTTWTQTCTDWYLNGEYTNTTCNAGSEEQVYLYTFCNYSGGSTGTITGSNANSSLIEVPELNVNEAVPCEGDPIFGINGIAPTSISGVVGGTFGCVRAGSDPKCNYTHGYHGGLDLKCEQNTPVYSMLSGSVIKVVKGFAINEYSSESYGNYITIRHTYPSGNTVDIKYAHLNSVYYSVGDEVVANVLIGRSGKTGNAAAPSVVAHLHIEVKNSGVSVDPAYYLATVLSNNGTVISKCNPNEQPFLMD